MKILFDFKCHACDVVFEELVDRDSPEPVTCLACGSTTTTRLVGTPIIDPRLGVDAQSWPTMGDKWERKQRQRAQIERKRTSYD